MKACWLKTPDTDTGQFPERELTVYKDGVVFINGSAVALKAYTAYGVRYLPARIEVDPGQQ